MKTIGNIIWVLFGGFFIALEYLISSILMMITIVGIPFGLQTLKLASLALWPFGRDAVVPGQRTGGLLIIMNILWFFLGGACIAISHLFMALLFAITIIGLPFANQHLKLAGLSLTPFGREIRAI